MSRGIARLGDKTIGNCTEHGSNIQGTIVSASSNTINNRGMARIGDLVLADCGHQSVIVTASANSYIDSRGMARLGDQVAQGDNHYTGMIITASPDTSN